MYVVLCAALALAGCANAMGVSNDDLDLPQHGELSLVFDAGVEDGPEDGAIGVPAPDLVGVCLSQVKINEVQTGGFGTSTAATTDEWVELYNPCTDAADLTGARLVFRTASALTDSLLVTLSGTIPAGAYYLVANGNYTGTVVPDVKPFAATVNLAPIGGAVGLRDALGGLVDSVGWGNANNALVETSAAAAPAGGHSIARTPNGMDTHNNAGDFQERAVPSPKAAN
jgi:hypothetical protein